VAGAVALLRTSFSPKSCPSEAIRYALGINAKVPGAPLTGINGNNMREFNPSNILNGEFNEKFDERSVKGKCNDRYGNGLIQIRDSLEWLWFYDCFSPILYAIQDIESKAVTLSRTVESRTVEIDGIFDSIQKERNKHDKIGNEDANNDSGEDFLDLNMWPSWVSYETPSSYEVMPSSRNDSSPNDQDTSPSSGEFDYSSDSIEEDERPGASSNNNNEVSVPMDALKILSGSGSSGGGSGKDANPGEKAYLLRQILPWTRYDQNRDKCFSG